MNILDEIIAHKYHEVKERKSLYPVKLLEQSMHFEVKPVSLKKYIQRKDKSGIIAEIKRRSPSKGIINPNISVEQVSIGYMQAGASALSVLTDEKYFGGANKDLQVAREFNYCPILRKDFVVDEYQIVEAKSIGADAILLVSAALEPNRIIELTQFAKSLQLEVLLEVHNENELELNLSADVDLIGVNNRDLKTFEVSIETSKQLASKIPDQFVKVAESGLDSAESIQTLKGVGFEGFLIGEAFMKSSQPELACAKLVNEIQGLTGV